MFPIASLLLNFFLGEGELIKKNQTEQSSGVASIACDQARETRGWKKSVQANEGCPENTFPGDSVQTM